ncbi:MAG TPA: hypothetical protein VFC00_06045 [Micromonosporaceae bacterium]|nr:hypothetical protein [Micromonosporaceae bacterium]
MDSTVGGNVVPFGGRRRSAPPVPPPLPPEHQSLHRRTRQAAPGARALAAEQSSKQRDRYAKAQQRQEEQRLLAEARPVPARITIALDFRGLEGPEVDIACGAEEPAVDLWECGVEVPTAEQVRLLADLTGFPIVSFYLPVEPGPVIDGMWICWAGRRGCQRPEPDYVDERGVLHYGGEPPRTPPAAVQPELFHVTPTQPAGGTYA